jgi:hypothetical protein
LTSNVFSNVEIASPGIGPTRRVAETLQDVAGKMCVAIARSWLERSRFREVVELCRATLQFGDNYRVLHALATAKNVLGETILAESYCEKAASSGESVGLIRLWQVAERVK